jgi:hypothetical protein
LALVVQGEQYQKLISVAAGRRRILRVCGVRPSIVVGVGDATYDSIPAPSVSVGSDDQQVPVGWEGDRERKTERFRPLLQGSRPGRNSVAEDQVATAAGTVNITATQATS